MSNQKVGLNEMSTQIETLVTPLTALIKLEGRVERERCPPRKDLSNATALIKIEGRVERLSTQIDA